MPPALRTPEDPEPNTHTAEFARHTPVYDTPPEPLRPPTIHKARVEERRPPTPGLPSSPDGRYTYKLDPEKTYGLSVEEIDRLYQQATAKLRDAAKFKGARKPTAQEEDIVLRFSDSVIAHGDKMGFDLRSRITLPEHVNIFPEHEDFAAARETPQAQSRGTYTPHQGVMVIERHNLLDNVYGILHEITHGFSNLLVTPHLEQQPDGSVLLDAAKSKVVVGWSTMGKAHPHAATESAVDMETHRGMLDIGLPRIVPGYTVGSLLLSGIVVDTAKRMSHHRQTNPQDVEDGIFKSLVSPDLAGIKMIQGALGEKAVKIFMNLPGNLHSPTMAGYASDDGIGSPTAHAALWARNAGVDTGWFNWHE
jgi:hypothetical protein